jgi:predicted peptidase
MRTGQHAYARGGGDSGLNYLLFLPQQYLVDPDVKWPLLVFLHGVAKRGDTQEALEDIKLDGPPKIVEDRSDFPFIVLSPQCPSETYWYPVLDRLETLIESIRTTYAVDERRIYLTGLSMGGFGTWRLALEYPDRFAAIVPIAGGYIFENDEVPEDICALKNLPIWVFHGGEDESVPSWQSKILVDALRQCPANVRFTLYPDANHADAWKQAYADPELYTWLLEQSLEE